MIIDQLEQTWNALLEFSGTFVTPDWGALIGLLPVFLLLLLVGPILSLLVLAWLVYGVRKPRARTSFRDLRRAARIDEQGQPVFPPGEPYSPRERIIYEPGTTRSDNGEELVMACPKCGLVRSATLSTCGNCGLTFSLKPTTRSARPASPPPGGAAAA